MSGKYIYLESCSGLRRGYRVFRGPLRSFNAVLNFYSTDVAGASRGRSDESSNTDPDLNTTVEANR